MIVASFSSSKFESDRSTIVSHKELSEFDGFDAGRTTDLSDGAGKGLSIGEGLTLLSDGVYDEAYESTAYSIISKRVALSLITFDKRHSKSMLGRS